MEFKLRRKGATVTVDGFPSNSVPVVITPPEGLEGIDLTAYAVIYAVFGRHGDDKARELRNRAPGAIVVYKYSWANGWGEGTLLPDRFDSSRVRFYKTAAQEKAEAEEAKKKASEALREEVLKVIPRVCVHVGYNDTVEVSPEQETFADGWRIYAKNIEEARAGVEKMRPIWEEWNARVLEIFARRGFQNPGNGNIQLVFYPYSPPYRRVDISFYKKGAPGSRGCILLEKQDGVWKEVS